mgnify:CR=1 FL=1
MPVPYVSLTDDAPADMPRRAMVLAAGYGTRMQPLTDDRPKGLVDVGGRPLIDHVLDTLARGGIEEVVVNVHHHADRMRAHLEGRGSPGVVISDESDRLMDTGGGVKKALPLLGEDPFFVANCDVLWLDGPRRALHRLWQTWDDAAMDACLMMVRSIATIGYEGIGDFVLDPMGRARRRAEQWVSPLLYGGVSLMHPRLFADTPDEPFSLNLVFDRAAENERLFGMVHDGSWCHVGTPEAVEQVNEFLADWPYAVGGAIP